MFSLAVPLLCATADLAEAQWLLKWKGTSWGFAQ